MAVGVLWILLGRYLWETRAIAIGDRAFGISAQALTKCA